MLQLVNLSNYHSDVSLIHNDAKVLQAFFNYHGLDGIEMNFCSPWNAHIHRKEWIHGVHLRFWPDWLDFWRGNHDALLRRFGSREEICNCYGGLTRAEWLRIYRDNIAQAHQAGAHYIVFHVSNAMTSELFGRTFSADDHEVIEAVIEVIEALAPFIPDDMQLLFENLWWPGLTLCDKALAGRLLTGVAHKNCGIMLDTGHLMNTNPNLKTEAEAIDYVMRTIDNLGEYADFIKGIHLHQSLSGEYVRHSFGRVMIEPSFADIFAHVSSIDQHRPFSLPQARHIIDQIRPQYVVHEFINQTLDEWSEKIRQQQTALGMRRGALVCNG